MNKKNTKRYGGLCAECGSPSCFLLCRICKNGWKEKALELTEQGVSPLSIAVRLNKSWRDVVKFLVRQEKIGPESWDIPRNKFF